MDAARATLAASIVARSSVPVAGMVLLGWKAVHLVLLYYVDTVVAIAASFALFFLHSKDRPEGHRYTPKEVFWLTFIVLFLTGVYACALGFPVILVLGLADDAGDLVQDSGFRVALGVQLAIACADFVIVSRQLRGRDDREKRIKARFGLVTMRWVALFAVALVIPWAPLLVVVYAGASVYFEMRPPRDIAFPG